MLGNRNGTIEIPANLGKAKEMIIVCPNIYTPAPGVTPGTDYSGYHKGLFSESNFKIQNPAYRPYVTLICCGTNDSVVGTFPIIFF